MHIHHLVEGKQQYDKKDAIVGGGPAGLTVAYELSTAGAESIVLEKTKWSVESQGQSSTKTITLI